METNNPNVARQQIQVITGDLTTSLANDAMAAAAADPGTDVVVAKQAGMASGFTVRFDQGLWTVT